MTKSCLQSLADVLPDAASATYVELCTILQEVYNINLDGGHGSRRKVTQLLLELGLQPNK